MCSLNLISVYAGLTSGPPDRSRIEVYRWVLSERNLDLGAPALRVRGASLFCRDDREDLDRIPSVAAVTSDSGRIHY